MKLFVKVEDEGDGRRVGRRRKQSRSDALSMIPAKAKISQQLQHVWLSNKIVDFLLSQSNDLNFQGPQAIRSALRSPP